MNKQSPVPVSEAERERINRIGTEIEDGIEFLSRVDPAISIFGAARIDSQSDWYSDAEKLAFQLSAKGIAIITGAGPGIMEAANRGAWGGEGLSVGLNIALPHEQKANAYLDLELNFRYFFTRKFSLLSYSRAFAFFPGGLGTVDELFELLMLMQTGKMPVRDVVLVGASYWQGLLDWIDGQLVGRGYVGQSDMSMVLLTDDIDKAAEHLMYSVLRQ